MRGYVRRCHDRPAQPHDRLVPRPATVGGVSRRDPRPAAARRASGRSSSSRSTTACRSTSTRSTATSPPQHYAFLIGEDEFDDDLRAHPSNAGSTTGPTRSMQPARDQPPRRRAWRLLPGSRRAPARDHHPSVRQRFVARCSPRIAGRIRAPPVSRSHFVSRRRWVRYT